MSPLTTSGSYKLASFELSKSVINILPGAWVMQKSGLTWAITAYAVTRQDPVFDQRLFKRKRAAQGKTHEVVAPDMRHLKRLFKEFASTPDAVSRQIGADVEIFAQTRQVRVAGLGNRENWTGFGICLGKPQEIMGQRLGQNDQIRLDIAGPQPAPLPPKLPYPDPPSLARP